MSTVRHLARIEELCVQEFPGAHGGFGAGPAGSGYHIAELSGCGGGAEDDGGAGAVRAALAEQCEAERDGLISLLTRRWGQPSWFGLGGVLLRALEYDEEIPEPWATLSACVSDVHMWQTGRRYVALGVAGLDPAQPPRLLAVVTDVDPP